MKIVILLYKGFTAMDVVGAYEVLCRLPGAQVTFAAKEKGIIESEYPSLKMVATHTLQEITGANLLLVPGSTYAFLKVAQDQEVLHQIRRIDAGTEWTISVCSGAIILGAAGLLKGKPATTHWALLEKLAEFGASPISERYVQEGKLITAAGVSAGIDMALYLTSIIAGEAYAQMVQLVTEYFPEPPVSNLDLDMVPKSVEMNAKAYLKKEILKKSSTMAAMN